MRKLKVYYEIRDNEDILPEMEDSIKKSVEEYGYKWIGQGVNIVDGMRDISFEKEEIGGSIYNTGASKKRNGGN